MGWALAAATGRWWRGGQSDERDQDARCVRAPDHAANRADPVQVHLHPDAAAAGPDGPRLGGDPVQPRRERPGRSGAPARRPCRLPGRGHPRAAGRAEPVQQLPRRWPQSGCCGACRATAGGRPGGGHLPGRGWQAAPWPGRRGLAAQDRRRYGRALQALGPTRDHRHRPNHRRRPGCAGAGRDTAGHRPGPARHAAPGAGPLHRCDQRADHHQTPRSLQGPTTGGCWRDRRLGGAAARHRLRRSAAGAAVQGLRPAWLLRRVGAWQAGRAARRRGHRHGPVQHLRDAGAAGVAQADRRRPRRRPRRGVQADGAAAGGACTASMSTRETGTRRSA